MDLSDPAVVTAIVVAVVVLVLIGLVVALVRRKKSETRRRERLQERFGPEYDRTVESAGDTRRGEARLAETEQRREQLDIKPLTAASRQRRVSQWQAVQADFVEVPVEAVDTADRLVSDVMAERGYPSGDSDERMQLLATDHADIVEHYRTAEAHRARFHSGEGSTEDLRRAFVEYRRLFDVLVEEGASDTTADDAAGSGSRRDPAATPVRPEDDEPEDLDAQDRGAQDRGAAQDLDAPDRGAQDRGAAQDLDAPDRGAQDEGAPDRGVEDRGAEDPGAQDDQPVGGRRNPAPEAGPASGGSTAAGLADHDARLTDRDGR